MRKSPASSRPSLGESDRPNGVRLVEQALEHIENGIRAGLYPPGHRLVEAEVASRSGLNIGPVREALRLLAGEGLVEIRPFRGASVKRLSPGELVQIYQAVKGIVYVSLTLAAEVCPHSPARQRLASAMTAVRVAAHQAPLYKFLSEVAAYYLTLHEIVGNTYLTTLIKRLHFGLVHRELANLLGEMDRDDVVTAYARATAALLKGDAKQAIQIKFEYFDRLIERVRAFDRPASDAAAPGRRTRDVAAAKGR